MCVNKTFSKQSQCHSLTREIVQVLEFILAVFIALDNLRVSLTDTESSFKKSISLTL